jgi:putative secretion ATPase (PEP-CTERM system associated)
MYERFYNLRERPFSLSPDPDYLYPSRVHTEALNYLRYGIEGHAGFVVITGEIGSGKTTLLQTAMRGLDTRTSVARLVNTMLDARELIEAVMLDFGLDPQPSQSKPHLLRDLARFLVDQRTAGRMPLLIIDEAQNLSQAALEEIRMLSNLETEKSKLIQIVLVGQPSLHDLLGRPEFEQLRQRVTVRYHLHPLDPGETAAYINHRLKKAAIGAPMVLSSDVTELIGRASYGLPRKINVIADAVLLFGYGEDKHTIDAALVREVIAELEATGILAPSTLTALSSPTSSPAAAASPAARVPATQPPPEVAAAAHAAAEAAAAAERLAAREAAIEKRERQVAEQHRVLTEQYRLMKARQAQPPAVAQATSAPPWPPRPAATVGAPPASTTRATLQAQPAWGMRQNHRPIPNLWTRIRRSLLGLGQPQFED